MTHIKTTIENNKPMTIAEFCAKYRISRTTVWKEEQRGKLEVTRLGQSIRITPEQEARYLDKCSRREAGKLTKTRGAA